MAVGVCEGALFGATRMEWACSNGVSLVASLLCPNVVASLPWILGSAVVMALTLSALRLVSFGEAMFEGASDGMIVQTEMSVGTFVEVG